ncbi:MAG: HipA domain-containing protein [Chlorobiales bacterium]|nr:HipA domain-containing protein [Chlorobiales bacterium]
MSKTIQHSATICIGEVGILVGQLTYAKSGLRENSSFSYTQQWLQSTERFSFSPDLDLIEGHQYHKAASGSDSVFHLGIADTEPDGWGCRVIARDHAKRRKILLADGREQSFEPLTEWDYLAGVDDVSRVGALRICDENGNYLRTIEGHERATPPLLELAHLLGASQAVERKKETEADLRYLRGRGTSLGGLRPKCSIIDDGHLAIGKFPSITDERSVTKGEVLALHLALAAGINAAQSRIIVTDNSSIAVIRRFDRTHNGGRIPYLSAASMLQAGRDEERAYTEIAERIISMCAEPKHDLAELWRRIVFNLLITNVDDHLHNHGFLHVHHGQWRLAPAFDLNPFPDKDQELKTWLTEDTGPVSSIKEIMNVADHFWLEHTQAIKILDEVYCAVKNWRTVGVNPAVGMQPHDLSDFAPAFEHQQIKIAASILNR